MRLVKSLVFAGMFTALALVARPVPLTAHHAVAPFYDLTKTVEFDGVVTKWLFKNPHSFIYLEATDANGQKTEWEVELGAPIILSKAGWTPETVKVGDVLHAKGSPSRAPGTHGLSQMAGGSLVRKDGSRIGPPPDLGGGRGRE